MLIPDTVYVNNTIFERDPRVKNTYIFFLSQRRSISGEPKMRIIQSEMYTGMNSPRGTSC